MNFCRMIWLGFAGLSLGLSAAHSQVSLIDLGPRNPYLPSAAERSLGHSARGQVCPDRYVSLPFFEDFSRLDSFYPSCNLWQDRQVFVNSGMAYRAPSVGVATFDGLNEFGEPYLRNINTAQSYSADTLTSQRFDFSSFSALDELVLSYFYQPQGFGDRPEPDDSLVLEFKDTAGVWQLIRSYEGIPISTSSLAEFEFSQAFVPITDPAYLYDGFQFRFRNRAAISGNNDHWNVDYIYLDRNRDLSGRYPDVAFTEVPLSPFKVYSTVPWRHFSPNLWRDSLRMAQRNLSNLSGTLDREYELWEVEADRSPVGSLQLEPIPALTFGPSPNANDVRQAPLGGSPGPWQPQARSWLMSEYRILNPTDFQNAPQFFLNDTVRRFTDLNNYFAYDDGMAEARIIAQGVGTMVAMQFTTTVADTLRGIFVHMPHFLPRNSELDFINLKVWVADLNNEVYSNDILRLRYVPGFNGFYYIPLVDFFDEPTPVGLPANMPFYIGWQQASNVPVPIGFDRNNPEAMSRTFVRPTGGSWQGSELSGAVMMRPLLSLDFVPLTGLGEIAQSRAESPIELVCYPNPLQAGQPQLHWRIEGLSQEVLENCQWQLYNPLGQLLGSFKAEENPLTLPNLPAGLYRLNLRNGQGQDLGGQWLRLN